MDASPFKKGDQRIVWNDRKDDAFPDGAGKKLFWIGFAELLPLVAGVLLTEYLKSFFFPYDYIAMGLVASIIIACIFGKDVPDQPIRIQAAEQEPVRLP